MAKNAPGGRRIAFVGVVSALALMTVGAGASTVLLDGTFGATAGATTIAPYTDPASSGSIGLCDQAGKQITSGSVTATPFVWRAVSTQAAPAPYDNSGRTATLYAFQPLQGLAPGEWSGEQLTASSRYSNPAHPMAAATPGDASLGHFTSDFHPKWDDFIQLRIYFGTANEPAETLRYPTLDLQVTARTWHVVGGSTVDCASGTSVSLETIVLPTSTTTSVASASPGTSESTSTAGNAAGTSASRRSGNGGGGLRAASPTSLHDHRGGSVAAVHGQSVGGGDAALTAGLVAGGLVVLTGTSVLIARRRRPASASPGSGTVPDPDRKGHGE